VSVGGDNVGNGEINISYMKLGVTIIILFFVQSIIGQPLAENNKEFTKTDTGFIYFWSKEGYAPSIAFIRNPHPIVTYEDFSTKNISFGYALSYDGLGLDLVYLVKEYGKEYKLINYDSLTLKIIPVIINYTVYDYKFKSRQLRTRKFITKFKLADRTVRIKVYGKVHINIHSVKPLQITSYTSRQKNEK
jgi:hypothetical protein